MSKQFLFSLLICLLLSFAVPAQQSTDSANAILVDEFGRLAVSDLIARLDNTIGQFQNQPGSKIYLLHFRSRLELPGAGVRFLNGMKNYMVRNRGVLPDEIILVNGGAIESRRTQVWIAPAGTVPKPKINAYATTFEDDETARKFDEYYFEMTVDINNIGIENGYGFGDVNSLDAFAAAVKKEKSATAYVIVYPQYEKRYRNQIDAPNTAARMARRIRSELIGKHNLAASKIRIVNGGYRRLREVELWILPGGEHPPVATPNVFPKFNRRKRNK